jgi:hypothetical protein
MMLQRQRLPLVPTVGAGVDRLQPNLAESFNSDVDDWTAGVPPFGVCLKTPSSHAGLCAAVHSATRTLPMFFQDTGYS